MKTTSSKIGDVIVFADAFGVLLRRRDKMAKLALTTVIIAMQYGDRTTHLVVLNKKVSRCIVDHCVESV